MPLIFGGLLDFYTEETIVDGIISKVTDFTPMFMVVGAFYVGAGICWLLVDCTKSVDLPEEESPLDNDNI